MVRFEFASMPSHCLCLLVHKRFVSTVFEDKYNSTKGLFVVL